MSVEDLRKQLGGLDYPPWVVLHEDEVQELLPEYDRLQGENADLKAEVERQKKALQKIKDNEGKVCDLYADGCKHEACRSSYASWAIADKALKGATDER